MGFGCPEHRLLASLYADAAQKHSWRQEAEHHDHVHHLQKLVQHSPPAMSSWYDLLPFLSSAGSAPTSCDIACTCYHLSRSCSDLRAPRSFTTDWSNLTGVHCAVFSACLYQNLQEVPACPSFRHMNENDSLRHWHGNRKLGPRQRR